jgi:hypothetical protein
MIKLKSLLLENTVLYTLKGTPIKRYKNLVGKQVGPQLYVHKNYANKVIPQELLSKGVSLIGDFKYNCVMWDSKLNVIRFDESPDFDTAREPHVGNFIKILSDGNIVNGSSQTIWHHKWLWVMDDYTGFDINESKEWSKLWLSKVAEIAKGGSDAAWGSQLAKYGLK